MATPCRRKREALTFATIDSTVALCFALLINASILILAAAAFNANGKTDVVELGEAHLRCSSPLLGLAIAPTLFGIALLCCGLNSTVTATLAGQIVMEGFLKIRLQPWVRRLITRAIAIIPAAFVTIWYGDAGHGGAADPDPGRAQPAAFLRGLPARDVHRQQGEDGRAGRPALAERALPMLIAIVIAGLNVKLLFDFVIGGCSQAALFWNVGRPAIVEIVHEGENLWRPLARA